MVLGKTTYKLQLAVKSAKRGNYVVFVVHRERFINYCVNIIQDVLGESISERTANRIKIGNNTIQFITANKYEDIKDRCRGYQNLDVIIDHYWYEARSNSRYNAKFLSRFK